MPIVKTTNYTNDGHSLIDIEIGNVTQTYKAHKFKKFVGIKKGVK